MLDLERKSERSFVERMYSQDTQAIALELVKEQIFVKLKLTEINFNLKNIGNKKRNQILFFRQNIKFFFSGLKCIFI